MSSPIFRVPKSYGAPIGSLRGSGAGRIADIQAQNVAGSLSRSHRAQPAVPSSVGSRGRVVQPSPQLRHQADDDDDDKKTVTSDSSAVALDISQLQKGFRPQKSSSMATSSLSSSSYMQQPSPIITSYSQAGSSLNSDRDRLIPPPSPTVHQPSLNDPVSVPPTTSTSTSTSPSDATAEEETEFEPDPPVPDEKSDEIMSGFMWGQVANVGRFGVWWVVLGPLILSLFEGDSWGVGGSRVAYNLGMFLFSPLAGALAERLRVKSMLQYTTVARGVIYIFLLPLAFTFLKSGWVIDNSSHGFDLAFFIVFLALMFADGACIAFSNVVDIDSSGTDLVAQQYTVKVNDQLRTRFNSIHEGFFNLSMIVFAPLMALLALYAVRHFSSAQDSAAIGGTLALVFIVLCIVSVYQYGRYLPSALAPSAQRKLEKFEQEHTSTCNTFCMLFGEVKEGLALTWGAHRIRWRILFLAVETAVEDAMISLVIAEYAVRALAGESGNNTDFAKGNLYAAGIVAVGKVGGILASFLMHRVWAKSLDKDGKASDDAFKPLFLMVFLGGVSSLLLPLGYTLEQRMGASVVSTVLVFVGSFLFFAFSTAPKIGFMTLMQSLAADAEAPGRIFGIIPCVITATDSLILLGFSFLFQYIDNLEVSLWVCCGVICLHGVLEWLLGPWLVLQTPQEPTPASASAESAPATQPLLPNEAQ